jgi:hypothetical protein
MTRVLLAGSHPGHLQAFIDASHTSTLVSCQITWSYAFAAARTLLAGSHPFYLQANRDGFSHGVLFLSSNGMDVLLNETSLTYK